MTQKFENYWRNVLICIFSMTASFSYGQEDVVFQIDHILLPHQSGKISLHIPSKSYLQAPYTIVAEYPDGSQVSRVSMGTEVFSGLTMKGHYCFVIQSENGCLAEECVVMLECRKTSLGEICKNLTDDGGGDVVFFGTLNGTDGIDQINYTSETSLSTLALVSMQQATRNEINRVLAGGQQPTYGDQGISSDIKQSYDFASVFTLKGAKATATMTQFWINEGESRSTGDKRAPSDLVNVYPNPTTNFITVHSQISHIKEINIYENAYRLIGKYEDIRKTKFEIDVRNMSSGVMLLKIELENGIIRYKKVVKLME